MTDFDDVIEELTEAAKAGTLHTVAWLSDKGQGHYRFGHKGYASARQVLTDTLNNLRDGDTPESPAKVN